MIEIIFISFTNSHSIFWN